LAGADLNPVETWNKIESRQLMADLVFLDVDMPQLSGIELAKLIKSRVHIVFITAHPDFALQAFETDALDYLVKPVTYERFLRAIGKVKLLLHQQPDPVISEEDEFYIKSEVKGKMVKINFDDIICIEAKNNYVMIKAQDDDHLVYLTLKEFEEKLPDRKFIRVHKSAIINLRKIKSLEGNIVCMENDLKVAIGSSYKANLLRIINPKLISSKRLQ
jgi:DNA-binding LytR/AlgR family response regulator